MRIILSTFIIFLVYSSGLQGQMKRGDYPFCIIEQSIFSNNSLIVESKGRPENFISRRENWYKTKLNMELGVNFQEIELIDSLTLSINLINRNKEIERLVKRIKEIHSIANKRAFVAGFTNNSSDTISFPIQDESLIAILEAQDENKQWNPIQFWPISGCGNSYYSIYLAPGSTFLCTVDNNFGKQRTKMRLRLNGNDTIFISNKFEGTIDKKIFDKSLNSVENFKHILCDSLFYLEKPNFGEFNWELDIEIEDIEEEIIQPKK